HHAARVDEPARRHRVLHLEDDRALAGEVDPHHGMPAAVAHLAAATHHHVHGALAALGLAVRPRSAVRVAPAAVEYDARAVCRIPVIVCGLGRAGAVGTYR